LIEVFIILAKNSEYTLNKFDNYDELMIDLRICIFKIFETSNIYLNTVYKYSIYFYVWCY